MVYEMRFQTVDPAKRAEYVKIYREAVQGCKSAGSTGGHDPMQRRRSIGGHRDFAMGKQGTSGRWRGTPSYSPFRAAVEGLQTKKSHGGFYVAETI